MATRQNTFILKRSNIPGKVPTQLQLGEVALNTADVILYASGTTANSILPIGWDRVARTGDTMTGTLYVPTISATTYSNLPTDIRVTGGTYSNGTATFTNNTGGTFSVTGFSTGNTDTYVTGFTYNNNVFTISNNTGGTLSVLANTMSGLTINGALTVTGATTSNSLSAATISSTTSTVSGVTFNKLLKEKVGSVAGSSFSGVIKTYAVTFGTNFSDTNYGIVITGPANRTYTYESQTVSGFTINTNSISSISGNVYWMAKQIGEV